MVLVCGSVPTLLVLTVLWRDVVVVTGSEGNVLVVSGTLFKVLVLAVVCGTVVAGIVLALE